MRRSSQRDHRIVVITGASSGIGRAAAQELARHGTALVLTGRRHAALDELARACEAVGAHCEVVVGDVADVDHVKEITRRALDRFGRIDVWVNNAGVLMFGRLDQCPPESYRRVIEVNLLGTMHGAHNALDVFRRQGRGVLVNVSSLLGAFASRYASAYVASKHGVEGLAEALRQETIDLPDVHVCNILPAGVDTPVVEHAANYLGRSVTPAGYPLVGADDVAAAIVKCIERPQPTLVVGRVGRLQQVVQKVAPRAQDWLIARSTGAALRRADEIPTTDGNLFRPLGEATSVAGGWKAGRRGRRRRAAAVVAGGAAVVVTARRARRRREGA
ncbi:MAG TPA: SDR family oxidoreductase [Actinomycetota bacterium]|nr:SDR family oxidoreductase [Actinomycetota bacterium]